MEVDEQVFYLAPSVECKNARNDYRLPGYDPDQICHLILLPYPVLPPTTYDEDEAADAADPIDWPTPDWKRPFVCIECGQFQEFTERDVNWIEIVKSATGRYRNDTNCYSVELSCARAECRKPVKFFVELQDRTEADLHNEIKKGFMGNWPCGHPALANPHQQPKIERVYLGPIC